MDATAYLTRLGWLGTGHSLHPTGRGIEKPLLVSHKSNVLGIGKKKHDAQADQWWARTFDAGLKNLNISRSPRTGATGSVTAGTLGQLDMHKVGGHKWAGNGGLYAGFVKGEGLSGTITFRSMRDERKGGDSNDTMEGVRSGLKREKREREVEGRLLQDHESQRKRVRRRTEAAAAVDKIPQMAFA